MSVAVVSSSREQLATTRNAASPVESGEFVAQLEPDLVMEALPVVQSTF